MEPEVSNVMDALTDVDWVEPTRAATDSNSAPSCEVLTDLDVATWRENGYCLVDDVYPEELLERLLSDAKSIYPPPLSEKAAKITDFGGGVLTFPAYCDSLNELALHPRVLKAVSQLLGEPDAMNLRLTQAEVWPKYGRPDDGTRDEYDNADQRIHCDFPNHTLTHPPTWYHPEAVEMIVYLSEVEECLGATAVVPRSGDSDPAYQYPIYQMPGFGLLQWKNNRKLVESYLEEVDPEIAQFRATHLYPREKRVRYKKGTVLFYRHDTWHRGTELVPGCLRLVVNMTFKKAPSDWVSNLHVGWSWAMYRKTLQMEKLVATSSVEQRCVLGFPKPGHSYWNKDTLLAVCARYGKLGMDMQPYIDACIQAGHQ